MSEFGRLVRGRRMVRAFSSEPIASAVVDDVIDLARRGPSAGNTASLEFLVLEGCEQTARYWDTTLPADRREAFPWPLLLDAPVLIVPWVEPGAYVRRYAEPDKAKTGLGGSEDSWPVPYWWVDGGAAVMTALLAAEDLGLGALFFGLFEHESAVRTAFGVPEAFRALGALAIGHRATDRRSSSSGRPRPPIAQVTHRGRW